MIRFVRGDRLWGVTLLNLVRLTLVRHDDRHWGAHRHRDGGELVTNAGRTSLFVTWRDDPDRADGLGRR